MRTETTTRELYQFDELDDKAKNKARDWYREAQANDSDWSEQVTDDAKEQLKLLGFTIKDIYWSGFSSQGDGACFVGTWSAQDVNAKALAENCPSEYTDKDGATHVCEGNKELNALAATLDTLASVFPEANATITHRDMYYHDNSVDFSCEGFEAGGDTPVWCSKDEKEFIEAARGCMRWIYRQLEEAYNWQNADEQVDENIMANVYEFTKEGRRA